MANVVLYSTKCPRCLVLEKKLTQKGIAFEEVNNVDIMMEKGYMAAPMLEVDGESMDFMAATNWINNQ